MLLLQFFFARKKYIDTLHKAVLFLAHVEFKEMGEHERKESFMKNESQLKSSKRGVLLRLAIFMALMISAFIIPSSALADFGYTEDSTNYTIDTGANLVFKVKRSNGEFHRLFTTELTITATQTKIHTSKPVLVSRT